MIRPEEQSDGELLRRMSAGDDESFRAIYRRCHGPIYRFALHMTGNPSIAEDVTQEVFVVLIEETGRFDPARGTLAAYLFGIGRNLLSRRLERDRPFVPLPDNESFTGARAGFGNGSGSGSRNSSSHGPDSGSSSSMGNGTGHAGSLITLPPDPVRQETIDRVRQAVLCLPANYREAVVLCDLQELSYEEAAATLSCAVGTVRSRLHRGRALLTERLRSFQNIRTRPAVAGRRNREVAL